jgi:hypothetical protein
VGISLTPKSALNPCKSVQSVSSVVYAFGGIALLVAV